MIEIADINGVRYAGFPNDHLFKEIKGGNDFVDHFLKDVIAKYVHQDSVCVDVGANLGYVSLYLAARAKKVIALEPQPVVFMQLCANLFLNSRFNVTPHRLAAHSTPCMLDFAGYQSGWVGATSFDDYTKIGSIGSISLSACHDGEMQAVRLDDLIDEKVDFIKVDAQGADIDVILGAEALLEKYHPVVVFEYEDDLSQANYHRTIADLTPLLERLGYKTTEIFPGNYLLT